MRTTLTKGVTHVSNLGTGEAKVAELMKSVAEFSRFLGVWCLCVSQPVFKWENLPQGTALNFMQKELPTRRVKCIIFKK